MASLLEMATNPSQAMNIPLMVQAPQNTAVDRMTKAATLRDMNIRQGILQNQLTQSNTETSDLMATRDAVSKNTSVDPTTGQPSTDLQGAVKDLSAVSPTAALNLQISMQQRQTELAEKKAELQGKSLANQSSQVNLLGSLARGVNSQEDLDRLKTNAPSLGLDASKLPDVYDANQINQFKNQAMTAGEDINKKIETTRLALTAAKQTKEMQQMDATATNEIAGQYKDDTASKEYINSANTYQTLKSMQSTPEFSKGLKDRDLLYNFQNIINPNRSATGGTIEQDEEARSILGGMGVDLKKVLGGDTLTPAQRQQITAFVENKFKDQTMAQQQVFNSYQSRLINMRAQGRDVDPYNALPRYGAMVDDPANKGQKKWVGVENHAPTQYQQNGDAGATAPAAAPVATEGVTGKQVQNSDGIKLDGLPPKEDTAPAINASELQAPLPKGGNIPKPPGGKVATAADIQATAKRYGVSVEKVMQDAKAKGYAIEGQ